MGLGTDIVEAQQQFPRLTFDQESHHDLKRELKLSLPVGPNDSRAVMNRDIDR